MNLPLEFVEFLEKWKIDPNLYNMASTIPRVIRFKNSDNLNENVEKLKSELRTKVSRIEWLPREFFCFSQDVKLANVSLYKAGLVYGIDSSSALSVIALDPREGESFLDLCCAPGAKLSFLSDYLKYNVGAKEYYITGVDISLQRLYICKSLIEKYSCQNIRLVLADGTTFKCDSQDFPFYEKKKMKNLLKKENPLEKHSSILVFRNGTWMRDHIETQKGNLKGIKDLEMYDKVLVDAECSTDGSVRHLAKMTSEEWKDFQLIYGSKDRLEKICALQKKLIHNGFRHLKKGGILVYSTCSFLTIQNEDVIEWLIQTEKTAKIIPSCIPKNTPFKNGSIQYSLRFDPSIEMSGFFLCSITKI